MHHVRFQNTLFQRFFEWLYSLHQISRELIKTNRWTLPFESLIQKERIYISLKFLSDTDAAGQDALLVNHWSTPKARSQKPNG